MKKRQRYTDDVKRFVLAQMSAGTKPEAALRACGIDVSLCSEKYALKLVNKWKKEVYEQNERMYFLANKISKENISCEIEFLSFEDENLDKKPYKN